MYVPLKMRFSKTHSVQAKQVMKVISSTFLPVKGFSAMNLFGVVVAREDSLPLSKRILNHEAIHSFQIKELFFIGFYVWYVIEWLFRLVYYRDFKEAYKNTCFEREAFDNDGDTNYLIQRKRFAFLPYLFGKKQSLF